MRKSLPTAIAVRVREEARYGRLPLLPEERDLGLRRALAAHLSIVMNFWPLLVGMLLPQEDSLFRSFWALLAGTFFGATLSMLSALAAGRYGIDAVDSLKCVFGQRGAKLFIFVFLAAATLEVQALCTLVFDLFKSLAFVYRVASPNTSLLMLVGFYSLVGAACAQGPLFAGRLSYVVLPANVLILGLLALLGVQESTLAPYLQKEIAPTLPKAGSYIIYFSVGASLVLKEWAQTTALVRDAATRSAALVPIFTILAPGLTGMTWLGLMLSKMTGFASVGLWLQMLGGPSFLGVCVILMIGATLVASSTQLAFLALFLRHFRACRRFSWSQNIWALCTFELLVGTASFVQENIMLQYLCAIGLVLGAGLTVVCLNYHFLRGQRLELSAVFDDALNGRYRYDFGFKKSSVALWLSLVSSTAAIIYLFEIGVLSNYAVYIASFPLCVSLCFLYFWVNVKGDAIKLERADQRPWPRIPRVSNL